MFFDVSLSKKENFPCQYSLGNLVLNTDSGWHLLEKNNFKYVYKGYCYQYPMENILDCACHDHEGNFCIFRYNLSTGVTEIVTDKWRSFPIWFESDCSITNLQILSNEAFADSQIEFDNKLDIVYKTKNLIGSFENTMTKVQVVDLLYNNLYQKIDKFLNHNKLPVKSFVSGGADSTLVYSFFDILADNFEHVFNQHIDWDLFWCHNAVKLKNQFWSYRQIHHWIEPCIVTSGAPGDEFTMRNPKVVHWYLLHHGLQIEDFLSDSDRYAQKLYYEKHLEKLKSDQNHQKTCNEVKQMTKEEFYHFVCNWTLNDYQHWHLGNTITFTPLRDFDCFKHLLMLSPEDLRGQISGASIHIDLIKRNNPEILNYLSETKNTNEVYKNIYKLMCKISHNSGQ